MKNIKYIAMLLAGGAMYGTMSSFVKLCYQRGYNAAEISFAQAALACFVLGLIFLSTCRREKFSLSVFLQIIFTGSAIGLTNFLYYTSVTYIPASLSIVILMQFTWFSILLEKIFLHKTPSKVQLIAVALVLLGTIVASGLLNSGVYAFSIKGVLFAILSSITYASYIVTNSKIGNNISWQSKSTFIMLGSALTILIVNYTSIVSSNHFEDLSFLLWIVFLAIIGTCIPTVLFSIAIPQVGAGISSILMTIELPVAILCAHIILKERIHFSQIAGVLIMLFAICLMNYSKAKAL